VSVFDTPLLRNPFKISTLHFTPPCRPPLAVPLAVPLSPSLLRHPTLRRRLPPSPFVGRECTRSDFVCRTLCGFCLLWLIYAQGPLDEIRPCAKPPLFAHGTLAAPLSAAIRRLHSPAAPLSAAIRRLHSPAAPLLRGEIIFPAASGKTNFPAPHFLRHPTPLRPFALPSSPYARDLPPAAAPLIGGPASRTFCISREELLNLKDSRH